MSDTAKSFVTECLTIDPASRPTAAEALRHKWLASEEPHFVQSPSGGPTNLLPQIQKAFDAKKTFRKAVLAVIAVKRMSMLACVNSSMCGLPVSGFVARFEQWKDHIDQVRCRSITVSSVYYHAVTASLLFSTRLGCQN